MTSTLAFWTAHFCVHTSKKKELFGVKFYALFGNFHFKFTFHIWRVGRNIWWYNSKKQHLIFFSNVIYSCRSFNNKILTIFNLAFHSFFLCTTGSATLLSLVSRKLDSRRTQNSFHMFNKRYLSWFLRFIKWDGI